MTRAEVIVVDRGARRRARPLEARALVTAVSQLRRDSRWRAGIADPARGAPVAGGLRAHEAALVVEDPRARAVVWVAAFMMSGSRRSGDLVESIVPGAGALWQFHGGGSNAGRPEWCALRRAHAVVLLDRACDLPAAICRRIRADDPEMLRRAVRAWLSGDEELAVRVVYSAVAASVVRDRPEYRRAWSRLRRSR